MPKLPVVKARDVVRALKKVGFFIHHQVGSHAQLKDGSGKRTTVPVHGGADIGKKTLKSILDDAEISVERFTRLLKK